MTAFYNEIDPFAAAWLRELIKDGLIAEGVVDERSIEDIRPDELMGYTQCHFFAGIGVWSLALRQAGWPDDAPIWTGSCPCQPFSAAGKGGGFADERHLWPHLHYLIEQCQPSVVVGEQVASKDGLAWLDLVQTDLEATGYASGAVDTCAAGFGAPHIRQRLYWVAYASHDRHEWSGNAWTWRDGLSDGGTTGRLADAERINGEQRQRFAMQRRWPQCPEQVGVGVRIDGMAHTPSEGWRQTGCDATSDRKADSEQSRDRNSNGSAHDERSRMDKAPRPSPTNGYWRDADWLRCTDEKWRAVEPGSFPLAHAGTVRNRVGMLRGAGNAITVAQAQGFIEAVIECLPCPTTYPN